MKKLGSLILISACSLAQEPFNPERYKLLIPAEQDQRAWGRSLGSADSTTYIKKLDKPALGQVSSDNSPDVIKLNCGCIKVIDEVDPFGSTECRNISHDYAVMGDAMYSYYSRGVTNQEETEYWVTFRRPLSMSEWENNATGWIITNVEHTTLGSAKQDVTSEIASVLGHYVVIEAPYDTETPSCSVYLNYPMRKYYFETMYEYSDNTDDEDRAVDEYQEYVYTKPGFASTTLETVRSGGWYVEDGGWYHPTSYAWFPVDKTTQGVAKTKDFYFTGSAKRVNNLDGKCCGSIKAEIQDRIVSE